VAKISQFKLKIQNIFIHLLLNVKISTKNYVLGMFIKVLYQKYPNGKISPNLVTLILW
jgi:hypothetical protein